MSWEIFDYILQMKGERFFEHNQDNSFRGELNFFVVLRNA